MSASYSRRSTGSGFWPSSRNGVRNPTASASATVAASPSASGTRVEAPRRVEHPAHQRPRQPQRPAVRRRRRRRRRAPRTRRRTRARPRRGWRRACAARPIRRAAASAWRPAPPAITTRPAPSVNSATSRTATAISRSTPATRSHHVAHGMAVTLGNAATTAFCSAGSASAGTRAVATQVGRRAVQRARREDHEEVRAEALPVHPADARRPRPRSRTPWTSNVEPRRRGATPRWLRGGLLHRHLGPRAGASAASTSGPAVRALRAGGASLQVSTYSRVKYQRRSSPSSSRASAIDERRG